MKKISVLNIMILCIFLLSSCSAIEGIFKAGFWSGILVVGLVVIAIIFILANVFKKK